MMENEMLWDPFGIAGLRKDCKSGCVFMPGRLNIFQKSMLQWNALHPYSAIHVVRLAGSLDATRLRTCINAIVEKRGLTRLNLDSQHCTFQYDGGRADCEIQTVDGFQDAFSALVAEMQRQLNLPFALAEPFNPFRFLIASAGDSFFLGLVYFHAAADAESVVLLLKAIVNLYLGGGASACLDSPDLYPDSRAHLLRRHPMVVVRRLLGLPAQMLRFRQSHRAGSAVFVLSA